MLALLGVYGAVPLGQDGRHLQKQKLVDEALLGGCRQVVFTLLGMGLPVRSPPVCTSRRNTV